MNTMTLSMRSRVLNLPVLLATCAILILSGCNWSTLVSVSSSEESGNNHSRDPALSADGRFVAFTSKATNLVPGGGSSLSTRVFLRDLLSGTTTRVDISSGGIPGVDTSHQPAVSADGRYVAFSSDAQLVPGDTNNRDDIYLRDTVNTTTALVSMWDDVQFPEDSVEPAISADGRYVAFVTLFDPVFGNQGDTIYLRDTLSGTTTLVSVDAQGNRVVGSYSPPSVSADGRYVAFSSLLPYVTAPDFNLQGDVFVRDVVQGTTIRASVDMGGGQANNASTMPEISANGRYVVFYSEASDLVPGDTNGSYDVFVRDLLAATTTRVSLDSLENEGDDDSFSFSISADGRFVLFQSLAANLVDDDINGFEDLFVRDMVAGTTSRISVDELVNQANYYSSTVAMSADARYVAFESGALKLVSGDPQNQILIKSIPQLTVAAVVPDNLPIGATTAVTVSGSNFFAGATPIGLTASNVVIVDENTITMDVTVPENAPIGARDVTIGLPGTGPGQLAGSVGNCVGCVTFSPPGC